MVSGMMTRKIVRVMKAYRVSKWSLHRVHKDRHGFVTFVTEIEVTKFTESRVYINTRWEGRDTYDYIWFSTPAEAKQYIQKILSQELEDAMQRVNSIQGILMALDNLEDLKAGPLKCLA
jgi:hypothetical protein